MSKRPVGILIKDILDAIERIEQYTENMLFEAFSNDQKTVDAVARNLEIIGEAANRLSDDFKEEQSAIEWYKIVGLRHRIIHEYFGIDLEIIWQIINTDLPVLRDMLSRIL